MVKIRLAYGVFKNKPLFSGLVDKTRLGYTRQ